MNKKRKLKEKFLRGQVIPIVAVSMVVLLAFTAMAIDGGNIYLQRQKAQNAADQAVITAALEKVREGNWYYAGLNRADDNGYNNDGILNSVDVHNPPISGLFSGDGDYVQVIIHQTVEPFFLQLFYKDNFNLSVTSIAHSVGTYDNFAKAVGSAIVSLGNCIDSGGHNLEFTGGGNSGGIVIKHGGIFLNSPEDSSTDCALAPPNNGYGIVVESGAITSVGDYDYNGEANIHPIPIDTGYNGGEPITDPWGTIPEPTCNSAGTIDTSGAVDEYSPGTFATLNTGHLLPGIYCVTGNIELSGLGYLYGTGVLLYLQGGISFTGNAYMILDAPTLGDCLGTAPSTSASCSYVGMVIFSARGNTSTIEIRGNGNNGLRGMVYAPDGSVESAGGGESPDEIDIIGQVVAQKIIGNGNGSFTVDYQVDWTYPPPPDPPIIEMVE